MESRHPEVSRPPLKHVVFGHLEGDACVRNIVYQKHALPPEIGVKGIDYPRLFGCILDSRIELDLDTRQPPYAELVSEYPRRVESSPADCDDDIGLVSAIDDLLGEFL